MLPEPLGHACISCLRRIKQFSFRLLAASLLGAGKEKNGAQGKRYFSDFALRRRTKLGRKSPRIKGPKDRVVFTSTQAIGALQVSSATFYRHVRELGMRPRRKCKSNARWWNYDDLLRLPNSVYPTVEERADLFFRMREGTG